MIEIRPIFGNWKKSDLETAKKIFADCVMSANNTKTAFKNHIKGIEYNELFKCVYGYYPDD